MSQCRIPDCQSSIRDTDYQFQIFRLSMCEGELCVRI
jgi:hypothetical protein